MTTGAEIHEGAIETEEKHFSKMDDNKWVLSEYDGDNAVLALSSVPFQIALGDIYDRVEFELEE